jgi:hypothetical protein
MKKLVYLTLLPLFLTQIAHAQKTRTLFYDDILYGKVKQISEIEYYPKSTGIELKDTTWYDEKGNTLENHRRTKHGTLFKEKYITTSDASGRKMEIIGSEKDQNLSAKLDSRGNLIEFNSDFKSGGVNFRSVYEYDKRNDLLSFSSFDKNNSLTLKKTYKYDKKNNLIEADYWREDGKLDYQTTFEYTGIDKTGNWTKRISHKKLPTGQIVDDLIIERQITYY